MVRNRGSRLLLQILAFGYAVACGCSSGGGGSQDCDSGQATLDVGAIDAPDEITPGSHELHFEDGQLFFIHMSELAYDEPEAAEILVAVHGFSGRLLTEEGVERVWSEIERWTPLAEELGLVVLAPQFDEERFDNDYQRLNLGGATRADLRLHALVDLLGLLIPDLPTEQFLLFGFSGGGQFTHRYTSVHPHRVRVAVAGAAGWYMWPDDSITYPLGTSDPPCIAPVDVSLLCREDLLIIVGAEDDGSDGGMRTNPELCELQGMTRTARAVNWVDELLQSQGAAASECNVELSVVPGVGHSINSEMMEEMENWFRG